ncbi:MAG: VOC family protein [Halobacteriales archaeon]|nr:VOC family protein [Halobacteriales archaeon]
MTGITFFGSRALEAVVAFYVDRLGAEVWLEQPDCTVLKYDNQLLGFCARDDAETDGTLTFVVDDREAVDALHDALADVARGEPVENERYEIYQFFADDPEGRTVEVQAFLHETEPV